MNTVFANDDLDRLETDPTFSMGLPPTVVTAYRKRMQVIRNAMDTRDLRAMQSWHFEKLKGKRRDQYSMRLNRQYRLVMELHAEADGQKVVIIAVENYH